MGFTYAASKLVVQLADVRIIALGVLDFPKSAYHVNKNARTFLHPPGLRGSETAKIEVSRKYNLSKTRIVKSPTSIPLHLAPQVNLYVPVFRPVMGGYV